jgi:hypothetical protein
MAAVYQISDGPRSRAGGVRSCPYTQAMKRVWVWSIVFAAVALVGLFLVAAVDHRRLEPPEPLPGERHIESFLRWRPPPESVFYHLPAADGTPHLMATGALRLWASGPSAYIFDRSGRMVDWSSDIGDDPAFDRRWSAQRSRIAGPPLSLSALQEWLEGGG